VRIASTLRRDIMVLISPGRRSACEDVVISMEVVVACRSFQIASSPRPADMHSEETTLVSKHRSTTSGATHYTEDLLLSRHHNRRRPVLCDLDGGPARGGGYRCVISGAIRRVDLGRAQFSGVGSFQC